MNEDDFAALMGDQMDPNLALAGGLASQTPEQVQQFAQMYGVPSLAGGGAVAAQPQPFAQPQGPPMYDLSQLPAFGQQGGQGEMGPASPSFPVIDGMKSARYLSDNGSPFGGAGGFERFDANKSDADIIKELHSRGQFVEGTPEHAALQKKLDADSLRTFGQTQFTNPQSAGLVARRQAELRQVAEQQQVPADLQKMLLQTQLSPGESNRRQALQSEMANINSQMASGRLDPRTGRALITSMDRELQPLMQREAHSKQIAMQMERQSRMQQAAEMKSMQMHDRAVDMDGMLQKRVYDKETGLVWYHDGHGIKAVPAKPPGAEGAGGSTGASRGGKAAASDGELTQKEYITERSNINKQVDAQIAQRMKQVPPVQTSDSERTQMIIDNLNSHGLGATWEAHKGGIWARQQEKAAKQQGPAAAQPEQPMEQPTPQPVPNPMPQGPNPNAMPAPEFQQQMPGPQVAPPAQQAQQSKPPSMWTGVADAKPAEAAGDYEKLLASDSIPPTIRSDLAEINGLYKRALASGFTGGGGGSSDWKFLMDAMIKYGNINNPDMPKDTRSRAAAIYKLYANIAGK